MIGRRPFKQIQAFFFFALFFSLLSPQVMADQGEKIVINEISIKGNQKIEEATIRYKMKAKVGDEFSVENLREDVKTLYGTGYFDQVAVDSEGFEGGLRLIILVKEKPYIKEVEIRGNKGLETKKIMEKVDLPIGSIANPLILSQNAEKIRLFYEEEGYYQATVQSTVEPISDQEGKVVFTADEGGEFEIEEVEFSGNKAFSNYKLRKQMKTKRLFLFFFQGTLKGSELKADVDRLKGFYLNNGYLDVKVGEPQVEIDRERKKIRISVYIEEGSQFKVGKLSLSGNKILDEKTLLKDLATKTGEVFSYEGLQRDIFTMADKYGAKGYIYADVVPITEPNREKLRVDIDLAVTEGRQMILDRIEITGNDRTRDNVIRRALRIYEGDIFDSQALRIGKDALNSLGYFEEVKIDTVPGSGEDRLIVKLGVKERLTGTFSLGGGYGSVDGLMGMAQVAESNLFGTGLKVSLTAQIAQERQLYQFSVFNPKVLDTDNSIGFNLYRTERTQPSWDERVAGVDTTYGRPILWNLDGYLTYRYERVNISGIEEDAPSVVTGAAEDSTTSSLTLSLIRDRRDSLIDPTRGTKTLASAQYAGGFLGGTNNFVKYQLDASHYHPLFWKVVGVLHGNLGYAQGIDGSPLPLNERFFLGGPTTVRGFKYEDIGPMDENGEPYGGNKSLCFNVEMVFPLIETFKGVIFYDRGNVWGEDQNMSLSDMRHSAGVGLRFFSPLGPIRLEYGWKLDRKPDEKPGEFHFSVGAFF